MIISLRIFDGQSQILLNQTMQIYAKRDQPSTGFGVIDCQPALHAYDISPRFCKCSRLTSFAEAVPANLEEGLKELAAGDNRFSGTSFVWANVI